jgi:catechol 2,3-dioxygenase-like lactoylglutathione lyase family enzyme
MEITLNHTIIPSYDKVKSAEFYTRIFGFKYIGKFARFIVVRVNKTLCLDFASSEKFEPHHYAFKVSEHDFDTIFERLKMENIKYGSGPYEPENMKINHDNDGRGIYFRDANGHLLEILTTDYKIEES